MKLKPNIFSPIYESHLGSGNDESHPYFEGYINLEPVFNIADSAIPFSEMEYQVINSLVGSKGLKIMANIPSSILDNVHTVSKTQVFQIPQGTAYAVPVLVADVDLAYSHDGELLHVAPRMLNLRSILDSDTVTSHIDTALSSLNKGGYEPSALHYYSANFNNSGFLQGNVNSLYRLPSANEFRGSQLRARMDSFVSFIKRSNYDSKTTSIPMGIAAQDVESLALALLDNTKNLAIATSFVKPAGQQSRTKNLKTLTQLPRDGQTVAETMDILNTTLTDDDLEISSSALILDTLLSIPTDDNNDEMRFQLLRKSMLSPHHDYSSDVLFFNDFSFQGQIIRNDYMTGGIRRPFLKTQKTGPKSNNPFNKTTTSRFQTVKEIDPGLLDSFSDTLSAITKSSAANSQLIRRTGGMVEYDHQQSNQSSRNEKNNKLGTKLLSTTIDKIQTAYHNLPMIVLDKYLSKL